MLRCCSLGLLLVVSAHARTVSPSQRLPQHCATSVNATRGEVGPPTLPPKYGRMLYALTAVNPVLALLANDYVALRLRVPGCVPQANRGAPPTAAVYRTLFYFARLKPRLLFCIGAAIRGLQLTTILQFVFDPVAGVGAVSAYVVHDQYQSWLEAVADSECEASLPMTAEAQLTRVVRLPRLLSDEEIQSVHDLHAAVASQSELEHSEVVLRMLDGQSFAAENELNMRPLMYTALLVSASASSRMNACPGSDSSLRSAW